MRFPQGAGAILLLACGRVGFPDQDPLDAPSENPDAPEQGCTAWVRTRPQPLLNSTANDWEPALSPDGLLLIFTSSRTGSLQLYAADRAALGEDFGNVRQITELAAAGMRHASPTWSPDGARLFFSRDEVQMAARYTPTNRSFSATTATNELIGSAWDVSADGLELFYGFSMGVADLGHATRPAPGQAWVPDNAVAHLNRPSAPDGFPSFAEATQELYFEASVTIWKAARSAAGQPLGPAIEVPELLEAGDPEVSSNGLEIFYSSRETRSIGATDIFAAERTCR